jgi:DNA-binding NarL/FixJ family response regulator
MVSNMITIVLADDHNLVRKSLKSLFNTESDFNVVGEVEDGLAAINLVETIQPDILVLDMVMPGLNGLEVTRRLNSRGTRTRIVILSMQSCEAYVSQALNSGVKAYVLKDSPPEELIKAVREAQAGRNYLCSLLADQPSVSSQFKSAA